MRGTHTAAAAILGLIVLVVPAGSALAGGSWMKTTEESHEPGDEVKAVAYVGGRGTAEEGPFYARLSLTPHGPDGSFFGPWHDLGPVTIEPTGLEGYLAYRVVIEFTLPADLEPGEYSVVVENENGGYFGDLIGANVYVGMVPEYRPVYEWAFDEPFLEDLPDDALISGPFADVVVGDLRAGRYPAGAEQFLMDAGVLDEPGNVTTTTTAYRHLPPPLASDVSEGTVSRPASPDGRRLAPAPVALVEPTPAEEPGARLAGAVLTLLVIAAVALGSMAMSVQQGRRRGTPIAAGRWSGRRRHPQVGSEMVGEVAGVVVGAVDEARLATAEQVQPDHVEAGGS